MNKEFITVDVKMPIKAALDVMKHNKIKRLPVIRKGKFAGLVTMSMIRDALPSDATTLSAYELNYVISKITIGDIMLKEPITVSPDLPVEKAMWLGNEHGIGAFPVLENEELVGMISESDFSGVMLSALGLRGSDSKRITIDASGKRFGLLRKLVESLDSHKIPIMSIVSIPKSKKGDWLLILRLKTKDTTLAAEDLRKKGFKITDIT